MSRGRDAVLRLAAQTPLTPAPARFLFLRHGESEGNRRRVFQPPDEPLNATGLAQAGRAAEALRHAGIERIVASTMRRAWQTAEATAAATGLAIAPSDALRERFFGDMIGTSSAELDWTIEPPGGETLAAFVARSRAGLAAALDGAGTPLIVAHGGTLLVLLGALGFAADPALLANALPLAFEHYGGWRAVPLTAAVGMAEGLS